MSIRVRYVLQEYNLYGINSWRSYLQPEKGHVHLRFFIYNKQTKNKNRKAVLSLFVNKRYAHTFVHKNSNKGKHITVCFLKKSIIQNLREKREKNIIALYPLRYSLHVHLALKHDCKLEKTRVVNWKKNDCKLEKKNNCKLKKTRMVNWKNTIVNWEKKVW